MELGEYKKMDLLENEHFWFMAKRKFIDVVLDKYLTIKDPKILDIGCGTGAILAHLENRGHDVYGIDNSSEALKYCQEKNLNVKMGTANKVDYPDNHFDIILSLDVLEHLDNTESAIKEAYRLLKKDGLFLITIPAHQYLWSYHDVALHHKRRYEKDDFVDMFKDGWEIKIISWIHAAIFFPVFIIRRLGGKNNTKENSSDVKKLNKFINGFMNVIYTIEIGVFKIFGKLPFGVSIISVIRKK